MKEKERVFAQLMLACDLVVLMGSYKAAYWVREALAEYVDTSLPTLLPFIDYTWIILLIVPAWLIPLQMFRLYEPASYNSPGKTLEALLKAQMLAALALLSVMFFSPPGLGPSRSFLGTFIAISFASFAAEKIAVGAALKYRARLHSPDRRWKVLLIGDYADAEKYFDLARDHPYWDLEIVGIRPRLPVNGQSNGAHNENGTNSANQADGGNGTNGANAYEAWSAVLKGHVVDEVIAVSSWEESANWTDLAAACADRGITFRVLVMMPRPHVGKYQIEDLGRGAYFVSLETVPQAPLPLMFKRLLDIVGAVAGLSVCVMVYPVYALWLRFVSSGPTLFRQERLGRNGRAFALYKFRTMHVDAERVLPDLIDRNEMRGAIFKIKDDPRVIFGGHFMRRTHLDELPQFWNVLRGEMSLVGTRPPTPSEAAGYEARHYRRLSMRPGITGAWQVSGNGSVRDFEEVVKLDCEYIDNWSLMLDLKLVAKTMTKVIRGGGW